jgi:hypothetical protein
MKYLVVLVTVLLSSTLLFSGQHPIKKISVNKSITKKIIYYKGEQAHVFHSSTVSQS